MNTLVQILTHSKDNFFFLLDPFKKKNISYENLENLLQDISQIPQHSIFLPISNLLNQRYLTYTQEQNLISDLWQKYPQFKKPHPKIIQKNQDSSIISVPLVQYYFKNKEQKLDVTIGKELFQKSLLPKTKFDQFSSYMVLDFFQNPTIEKKDFFLQVGYNIDSLIHYATLFPKNKLPIQQFLDIFFTYFLNDILQQKVNTKIQPIVYQALTNFIVTSSYWKNPDSFFQSKISTNNRQVYYDNGNGSGDNFNYLYSNLKYSKNYLSYSSKISNKDIFLLPLAFLCGVSSQNSLKLIAFFMKLDPSKPLEVIHYYDSFFSNQKLSPLKKNILSLLKNNLLKEYLSQELQEKKQSSSLIKI